MNILKVGMVGLGLVSSSHLKGYLSHPNAEVTAVCDLELHRAQKFATIHGIPEVYVSYEEMLKNARIDAVSIATPNHLHAPMAKRAVESGKHVHSEKPFCRFVSEGTAAMEAGDRTGRKISVGETYLYISSFIKARELIDAGEIGRPLQIRQRHGPWVERSDNKTDLLPSNRDWRIDPEKSGGGDYPWIFDHAGHFFIAGEYLMQDQKIVEIYALAARDARAKKRSGAAHDPYITTQSDIPILTWRYEDSALQGLWARAEPLNGKFDYMQGFSVSIFGDKGMIDVLGEGGHNLLWNGKQVHLILHREGKEAVTFRFDEGGDDIWQSDICYYSKGHINQVQDFVDSVVKDTEPRVTAERGIRTVRCTLAAIKSAREGRPVLVDDIDPAYSAYG